MRLPDPGYNTSDFMSVGPILSNISLFVIGVMGTVATFHTRGMHTACGQVRFLSGLVSDVGTLTEAECASIFASAIKGAPEGKEDAAAALIFLVDSVVIRIEGVCFAMLMIGCWYTLFFVKYEHRYPVHVFLCKALSLAFVPRQLADAQLTDKSSILFNNTPPPTHLQVPSVAALSSLMVISTASCPLGTTTVSCRRAHWESPCRLVRCH